jgi:hypothetical protein
MDEGDGGDYGSGSSSNIPPAATCSISLLMFLISTFDRHEINFRGYL